MKKIMFNDKYGLTQAVLDGRKTQTRRVVKTYIEMPVINSEEDLLNVAKCNDEVLTKSALIGNYSYNVGEEVAVAQRYLDFRQPNGDVTEEFYKLCCENYMPLECLSSEAGAKNKMFVKADLMPHRIKITNVRVERLQDISDEDCLKEGIGRRGDTPLEFFVYGEADILFDTPQRAFASLIDKVSGKGTWESNPWVFVYDFELVR